MESIKDTQDNTDCLFAGNTESKYIVNIMTEPKKSSFAATLFAGMGIECSISDIKFYSISDIHSKVNIAAKRYSRSVSNTITNYFSLFTYEDIRYAEGKIQGIMEDCDSKMSFLKNLGESYGISINSTQCPAFLPMTIVEYRAECSDSFFSVSETNDSMNNVITGLYCCFSGIKWSCNQSIECRHGLDDSKDECLQHMKLYESNREWQIIYEAVTTDIIKTHKLDSSPQRAINFVEERFRIGSENSPIYAFADEDDSDKPSFAHKLATTPGVSLMDYVKYRITRVLEFKLLAKSKLSIWLKPEFIKKKVQIAEFIKLAITMLKAPKYKLSLGDAVASVWLWMEETMTKKTQRNKHYFVEFVNEDVLDGEHIQSNTVINLISQLNKNQNPDIDSAIAFCASQCELDRKIA